MSAITHSQTIPVSTVSTPSTSPSHSPPSSASSPDTDVDLDPNVPHSRFLFIPNAHQADPNALRAVVSAGLIALLLVKHHNQALGNERRLLFVQRALRTLKIAKRWIPVSDDSKLLRFVSSDGQGKDVKDLSIFEDDVNEPTLSRTTALRLFAYADLRSIICIPSHGRRYALYMLERPAVVFPTLGDSYTARDSSCVRQLNEWTTKLAGRGDLYQQSYVQNNYGGNDQVGVPVRKYYYTNAENPFGVPAPREWRTLWAAWDMVTLGMIPHAMLLQKPIHLRHKCLFYIGHIPTFLDILLSRALGGEPTDSKRFWDIFERGIDPHVDDPQTCHHFHSHVPEADEDWPSLSSIVSFRDNVRARLMKVYDDLISGKRLITRNVARMLVMAFEHEGFHVETLLYMLIQRAGTGTLSPPGFTPPLWTLLSSQWSAAPLPRTRNVLLGPSTVVLGHYDSEADDVVEEGQHVEGHAFGWDNESPPREVWVREFTVEWRPVSNGEYLRFLEETAGADKRGVPQSWVADCAELKVRTVYGPVAFEIAQHWPVLASYDDLAAYARSKGGRLPTEPELRLFLDTYEAGYDGGANVAFRNWHPVPATTGLEENGGLGSNGGVWEWTSTVFDRHEGFVPTKLFPGYSTDFFDGKHHVVLGASYATIPRIASRRTLRNFYQHNYPYAWIGARVVYDV